MPATSDFAIDHVRLARYLGEILGRPVSAEQLTTELIAGGFSNLTYLVRLPECELVLRRPPLGTFVAGSHDMAREHQILVGLAATDVPAPTVLGYCGDPAVIGAPFLLMERVAGLIVRDRDQAELLGSAGATALSHALADTLAAIHLVDLDASGLRALGRGEGFLQRQVVRWLRVVAEIEAPPPSMQALATIIARRAIPPTPRITLVHGDFRIDNVVLDDTLGIRAVLDWEMATVGDPLADLGLLLVYWGEVGDPVVSPEYEITAGPGFLTRREIVERYTLRVATTTAATASDELEFHVLLAHLKMAAIVHDIVARSRLGQTPDARFEHLDAIPAALCERALLALSSGEYT